MTLEELQQAAERRGAAAERAAIVAWRQQRAAALYGVNKNREAAYHEASAIAIEHADHHKAEPAQREGESE